jgi:hypothetical protein
MYTLLIGTKENAGDFLIVDRAKKLLKEHRSEHDFLEMRRWEPLDPYLDDVNKTSAILLCGGPAYQTNFYPGIYPLVENLSRIKVPIIPLGLGWKGFPGDEATLENYTFTSSSITLLKKIHAEARVTSCRDYLTKRVLAKNGFNNAMMTGDPAWYDLTRIGKSFEVPSDVKSIIVSTPANSIYHSQSIALAKALKKLFPRAEILCTFHHGWENSTYLSSEKAAVFRHLKEAFENSGFETITIAADLGMMEELYRTADFHVGYRLHAHLFFLSQRKPSFLLEEDGRGRGASETIGLRGIRAWSKNGYDALMNRIKISNIRYARSLVRRALGPVVVSGAHAIEEIISSITEEFENGFIRFREIGIVLDSYYHVMVNFLNSLP